jgi:hypothetical protein
VLIRVHPWFQNKHHHDFRIPLINPETIASTTDGHRFSRIEHHIKSHLCSTVFIGGFKTKRLRDRKSACGMGGGGQEVGGANLYSGTLHPADL